MKYTSKGPFEKGYNKMISAVENPEMMGMEFEPDENWDDE